MLCLRLLLPYAPDIAATTALSASISTGDVAGVRLLRLMSLVVSCDGGEACICDLNAAFDLSQPTISHHTRVGSFSAQRTPDYAAGAP